MCIQVDVYGPRGQEKFIELCDNEEQLKKMTVQDLRGKTAKEFNLSTDDDIRVIHKAEPLEETSKLSSYGIHHMSVIHLVLKVHGG